MIVRIISVILCLGIIPTALAQLRVVATWGTTGSGNGQFSVPTDATVDSGGNVYVSDLFNDRIQKFDADGSFIGKWGSSGSGNGQFTQPITLAADPKTDHIYVADRGNNRIQKFTSTGAFLFAWGLLGSGNGQFDRPSGVAVDSEGNVYVGDRNNHRIQKFDNTGAFLMAWGQMGSGNGQFMNPTRVAVDSDDQIFVSDAGNDRIQKFSSDGDFLAAFGALSKGAQLDNPSGIATDTAGNVYVVDDSSRLFKFDNDGAFVFEFGGPGTGNGQFGSPEGLAVNPALDIYVAESGNDRIQRLNGFMIGSGMSASYYDPDFNGQGINIEVLAEQTVSKSGKGIDPGLAVVYWYSFDPRGFPFFSFNVGEIIDNTINIDMLFDYDGAGPFFGPGWDNDQFTPVAFASATIRALGCDHLAFEFDSDDPGQFPEHTMTMERITAIAGTPCVPGKARDIPGAPGAADKGFLITDGMSGSFFDPAFTGQGINTEILVEQFIGKAGSPGVVLVYWYSFDPAGYPFFAFGVGEFTGDTMVVDMLIDYDGTGPFFGPAWNAGQFVPVPFATVTIVWADCDSGVMTFVVDPAFAGQFEAHTLELERITSIARLPCP